MADETKSVLQQLRKTFKGRLSRLTLFDSNVCECRTEPETPWILIPVEGQPFSRQLRFTYRKRKVELLENDTYVSLRVGGEFPSRIISFNARDAWHPHWVCAGKFFVVTDKTYPVYTKDRNLSEFERGLFASEEFAALIVETDLRDGESLHFYANEVKFYLKMPTAEHVQKVIERTIDLVEKIEVLEEPLDLTSLPVQFHPLIPLIKKWAISDDGDRADLLGKASKMALKKMVEKVSPYFEEIGTYLSSFGEKPPPEAACALGSLAECFMEAEQEIAKGGGSE